MDDRCRHICILCLFPEHKPLWTVTPITSHAHANVHKEDASSLHTHPVALENFSSSSLFMKLILIMRRFLFEVGVFLEPR